MPSSAITLCSSAELASLGSVKSVLAVCDSPVTVAQITAAAAFQSWPASSPIACLSLGKEASPLPQTICWLAESPFRSHVVLSRLSGDASARACSPDLLWMQLVESQDVWTGSIAEVSPAALAEWPELAPQSPAKPWLKLAIQSVEGSTPRQTTLFKAGLYLLHDYLDESHAQSQSMEGDRDADLWHAIMHRREPDYGNAKYWCRRVGSHPVHEALAPLAVPILADAGVAGFSAEKWDSIKFVDLCERVANEDSPANRAAREVQWLEMNLHLAHCARGR